MSMLKAANGLLEILNGSKDPVLVHHVAVVQFLSRPWLPEGWVVTSNGMRWEVNGNRRRGE